MKQFQFKNSQFCFIATVPTSVKSAYPSLRKLLKGNPSDMLDKMDGLFELWPGDVETYLDPMAGIGFSAELVQAMSNVQMSLNDLRPDWVRYLQGRFPSHEVFQQDLLQEESWNSLGRYDCVFHDQNTSLRTVTDWWRPSYHMFIGSVKAAKRTLLYTDTFPYSIIPFDMDRLLSYLQKCNLWMKNWGLFIHSCYLYRTRKVMIVRADKVPSEVDIRILSASDPFRCRPVTGLFR